jgi:hypothetical protein
MYVANNRCHILRWLVLVQGVREAKQDAFMTKFSICLFSSLKQLSIKCRIDHLNYFFIVTRTASANKPWNGFVKYDVKIMTCDIRVEIIPSEDGTLTDTKPHTITCLYPSRHNSIISVPAGGCFLAGDKCYFVMNWNEPSTTFIIDLWAFTLLSKHRFVWFLAEHSLGNLTTFIETFINVYHLYKTLMIG